MNRIYGRSLSRSRRNLANRHRRRRKIAATDLNYTSFDI